MKDLFDAALFAEQEGKLTEWIVDYLHQGGHNAVLARDLLKRGKFHTGFIEYPIDQLEKLLGPNKSFTYYEEPRRFEERVNAMIDSLHQGWRPVPLIASRIWSRDFELHDGAHRAEALRRSGIKNYLTVFYFEDEHSRDEFLSKELV